VGLSGISRSGPLGCSSRLGLVGNCNRPRRDTYARRMGRSVHEGHGLLNGETCRRVARAQVERERHVARAIGVTSWDRLSLSERSQPFAVPMPLKIVEIQCTVSTGR
jgi:hypothetical protein